MKLQAKVMSGFGVVCALLAVSGLLSIQRVGAIRNDMGEAMGEYTNLAALIEMQEMTTRKPLAAMEMMAATDAADLETQFAAYQRTKSEMDVQVQAFKDNPVASREALRLLANMDRSEENEIHPAMLEVHRLSALKLAGDRIASARLDELDTQLDGLIGKQIGQLEDTIKAVRTDVAATKVATDQVVGSTRAVLVVMMIVGLVLGAGIGFVVARGVARPVALLDQAAARIAKGDLTARIDAGLLAKKDEIGSLSRSFAGMADFLRGFVGEIAANVGVLGQASLELSATATQIEANAQAMADNSRTVTGSADTVSQSSGQVARGANDISERICTTAAAVEEMSASIAEVSSSCNRELQIAAHSNQRMMAARENVGRLHETAQHIDRVSQLIRDIADQTNLLALNATIEAASAGDAGRGFAVVAGEVKELARQTAKATTDIEESIRAIQEATLVSIREIDEVAGYTQQLNDVSQTIAAAVEQQSAAANEISCSLQRVSAGSAEIAESVNDSTDSLSGISQNVRSLDNAIRDTVAGVGRINDSVGNLTAVGRRLQEQTARVTLV